MAQDGPLRLAYIGAGGFTNAFMYPQLRVHSVELAAVCDLVEAKAQQAATQYGFQRVYTDFRRMLDEVQPEAVICVGGPTVHYEIGRQVLEAGFPLYVQKSPAPSAAQTQEMADIAAARGVVCHVGFNLRQSEAVRQARALVGSDEFGPLTMAMVRYGLVSGPTLENAVMDQHCHAYDTLRRLAGEVDDLEVRVANVPGKRAYVVAAHLTNGAVATVNFTSEQPWLQEFFYFELTGTNGHVLYSHDFDLLYRYPEGPEQHWRRGVYTGDRVADLRWLGYVPDVANFLAAVRGTDQDQSPVADAVGTMKLCEAVYHQLQQRGAER
ncbi:Gfo/Idh/MocA family oxidoreductase [bacterium]|nr:Gfo/Idh/MocA family oxidoreductase [bacterium]